MRGRIAAAILAATLCLPGTAFASHARFWGPMLALPKSVRATWACVMWAESRSTFSHLNLRDNNAAPGGDSGIFQINDSTWLARSGFKMHVWKATPFEQEVGAIRIWRADSWQPWIHDGCF